MDTPTRKRLFNLAKPREALSPNDPRCVDLSAARQRRLIDQLSSGPRLSDVPTVQLLAAPVGSGVSTFLRALCAVLASETRPVLLDLSATLDLASPIDLPEILLSLVDGAALGLSRDPLSSRFWESLRASEPSLNRPEFSVADPAHLLSELTLRPALREHLRAITASRLGELLRDVREELSLLDAHARAQHGGPLVLVCDSLETLRPPSHLFRETLASADSVLTRLVSLSLPVHVVMAAPVALITRALPMQLLPMLAVDTDEGARCAREIFARRLPSPAREEVLGSNAEARISRLIEATAGSVTELVRAAQSLIAEPELPLSEGDFDRLIAEITEGLARRPPSGDHAWLARAAETSTLSLEDSADRDKADLALSYGMILPLGQNRFALHPGIRLQT